ncbi:MAG TPA: YqgQ family protein [Bacillus sp. (in: firmicutes)]|uniref:YqgQ family protein n=1 Tax=Bacillus litorisediminis TaxID=2922713 RepID=UPI001FAEB850|nr:YqgQ family protein [Bacillus litorisediminis]HWO77633.1 YqgQ family protein [Bacillus sp. (in: firmicutes)]
MKTLYEVQQFLKQYGTIIYIGDRLADLRLMEDELKELYRSQLIETKDYQSAIMLIRIQITKELEQRGVEEK